jgi:hypothetical protein
MGWGGGAIWGLYRWAIGLEKKGGVAWKMLISKKNALRKIGKKKGALAPL